MASCSTTFPKGCEVLYDYTLFYVFQKTKNKKIPPKQNTKTKHKTERRKPGTEWLEMKVRQAQMQVW